MSKLVRLEQLIGMQVPSSLQNLEWEGKGQEGATDPLGNYWIRNSPEEIYLSVDSESRDSVYMTLTLFIEDNIITDVDWFATLASHGRPASVDPRRSEVKQMLRILGELM